MKINDEKHLSIETSKYPKKTIQKNLKNKQIQQKELIKEIDYYKSKILLLDENDIDVDFLEEKSYELGEAPENGFTVKIK